MLSCGKIENHELFLYRRNLVIGKFDRSRLFCAPCTIIYGYNVGPVGLGDCSNQL